MSGCQSGLPFGIEVVTFSRAFSPGRDSLDPRGASASGTKFIAYFRAPIALLSPSARFKLVYRLDRPTSSRAASAAFPFNNRLLQFVIDQPTTAHRRASDERRRNRKPSNRRDILRDSHYTLGGHFYVRDELAGVFATFIRVRPHAVDSRLFLRQIGFASQGRSRSKVLAAAALNYSASLFRLGE